LGTMVLAQQKKNPPTLRSGKEDAPVARKTDGDVTNYGRGVGGDNLNLDSASDEAVLQDYVMLDFVDDFVPTSEEINARGMRSGARPVPDA
jgi:hypothetical protein